MPPIVTIASASDTTSFICLTRFITSECSLRFFSITLRNPLIYFISCSRDSS
ncbi:hypothetical protein RHGRI_004018 [Rhododendron griersonianum]|uniref:Uncharacterized protein n=1 Tax=Rhododendron griersonianum TaxID=479676 RepID=A0AAV6L9Q8_9ERIC|nr:hypothetical protein RHGRI_004018 [Rhododendron griersonianum]